MAVYTKLTKEEIANHLADNYDIGQLIEYKEILAGIDNSNFIIETNTGRFILTIFESRIDKQDLPFFIGLKLHLAKKGICCPEPIISRKGDSISDLKGKKSAIVTFLNGEMLQPQKNGYYDNITEKHCNEVGKIVAKMQVAVDDFAINRENDLSPLRFGELFDKFSHYLFDEKTSYKFPFEKGQGEGSLYREIVDAIEFLEKNWDNNLPKGAVHLDLFPDNVFFNESGGLSGVIDFYFAASDLFLYDFAVIVNAWCFDENVKFDEGKYLSMKQGYEEFRRFSDSELAKLDIALMAASLRFLLTRLYDMFNTPKDSFVTIKDPREYLSKMRFFKNRIK